MMKNISYIIAIIISIIITSGCDTTEEVSGSPDIIAVAVGESGTLLTSHNGTNWTARTIPDATTTHLYAVAYGGYSDIKNQLQPLWLAAGANGTQGVILKSYDGINWVNIEHDYLQSIKRVNAISYRVKATTTSWVIVGELKDTNGFVAKINDIEELPDTITHTENANTLNDIANDGAGNWVAVGNKGTVLISDSGANWTSNVKWDDGTSTQTNKHNHNHNRRLKQR